MTRFLHREGNRIDVVAYRAQRIGNEEAPSLRIMAVSEIPEEKHVAYAITLRALFTEQAHAIWEALSASLPGGTINALRVEAVRSADILWTVPEQAAVPRQETDAEKEVRDAMRTLVIAVETYEKASANREHLGSYGLRLQEAAQQFVKSLPTRTSSGGGCECGTTNGIHAVDCSQYPANAPNYGSDP